jgi:hypothetical protein
MPDHLDIHAAPRAEPPGMATSGLAPSSVRMPLNCGAIHVQPE